MVFSSSAVCCCCQLCEYFRLFFSLNAQILHQQICKVGRLRRLFRGGFPRFEQVGNPFLELANLRPDFPDKAVCFWIFRFSSPFSVAIPFFSIWQAATPMWTVGISSMPRSALLRWSIRSGLPFLSKSRWYSQPMPCAKQAHSPCLFQPVRSTLCVLYLPLGKRIRSPFSSRSYSFLDFAAHAPRSSRGRMVSII